MMSGQDLLIAKIGLMLADLFAIAGEMPPIIRGTSLQSLEYARHKDFGMVALKLNQMLDEARFHAMPEDIAVQARAIIEMAESLQGESS